MIASDKGPFSEKQTSSHWLWGKGWIMRYSVLLSLALRLCLPVLLVTSVFAFCKHADMTHPGRIQGLQCYPVLPISPQPWGVYLYHFLSPSVCWRYGYSHTPSNLLRHTQNWQRNTDLSSWSLKPLICLGTFPRGKDTDMSFNYIHINTIHFCIYSSRDTLSCVATENHFDPSDNLVR